MARIRRSDVQVLMLTTQGLFCALLISSSLYYSLFMPSAETLIYPACVMLAILVVVSLWSWKTLANSLFDPYVLFLAAATLFNGGHAILEVLRSNENGILDGQYCPETILKALFVVILGLTSLHFGALISTLGCRKPPCRATGRNRSEIPARYIRLVGWVLLSISFIPALIRIRDAAIVVASSGYFGLYQTEAATGFGATLRVLASFLAPAVLFLLAGSKDHHGTTVVSAVLIIAHSSLQFFLGSRSAAVMPLIAYAWLWHRCIRPLPKPLLVGVGLVAILIVFPTIKAIRNIPAGERATFASFVNAFCSIENPAVAAIAEMGSSMRAVAGTIELVPRIRPFDMGVGYLYALLTLLPNLFWDIHPAVARGLAGDWLVWTLNPSIAARGGGYGFSFIAEAYLNLGYFGVVLISGLLGWILGRLVLWAQRSQEPARMAMLASFTAFFLVFARGESASIMRFIAWNALLPYGLAWLLFHLGRNRRRPLGSTGI